PTTTVSELRRNEQCCVTIKLERVMEETGNQGIRRKKCDIRDYHYLMIDRRDDRLVTAIDDIHEPVAVVLNQGSVADRKSVFRSEQENCHRDLQQGHGQSRQ